jgi:hypothetical protein
MQYGAVLNVGACTDPNHLHIAAHRRVGPNANVITQRDVTHDDSGGVDHHAVAQYRVNAQPFAYIDLASKIDGVQSVSPADFRRKCPRRLGQFPAATVRVVTLTP